MSSIGTQTTHEDFLAEALDSNRKAKDDAREYHKLTANEPKVLKFIIEDKSKDIQVERKNDENGKPYSQTVFLRVVNLNSEVQDEKPLRTSSKRLLEKLNEKFSEGSFTLEITKVGQNFDTDYKVRAVS